MSNAKDYTVGWICALKTEFAAAQSFLDEEHAPLAYQDVNDHNDYVLGRIGEHNVVIAVLPLGRYGSTSAAIVAGSLIRSFPNIRIGLMVGTAGGAPTSRNDIRLGDVVVGITSHHQGEILPYDAGKTIQGQKFQRIPSQNNVPLFLQTAVHGLQTQYDLKGHQIQEAIENAFRKNKRLEKNHCRPDPRTDVLYSSTYEHRSDIPQGASCLDFCGVGPSNTIHRRVREDYEDNPSIHYGKIASGNTLMKNALVRDTLANEEGILCFEMEAAGLLNHFPCLVIRGICNYSDTHKNKEWQGYAAMTAAAYAKDILCRIRPSKIETERNTRDFVSSSELSNRRLASDNYRNFEQNKRGLQYQIEDTPSRQREDDIHRLSSLPDPSAYYYVAQWPRH